MKKALDKQFYYGDKLKNKRYELREMAIRRGVGIEFHQTGNGNRLLVGQANSSRKGVVL
jgi:hypothetical protein